MNIIDWLTEKKDCDTNAIVTENKSITYSQLYGYSISLSKQIKTVASMNIGLYAKSTYKYIIGYFAILLAGKCVVPFKPSGSDEDKKYVVNKADIDFIVTDTELKLKNVHYLFIEENDSDTDTILPTHDENTDILLLETTGTTGEKKLVRLNEKNLQFVVNRYCEIRQYNTNEPINYMILLPLQSAYGNFVFLACMKTGATLYIKDDFMPWDFRDMVIENNITHIECISSLLMALTKIYKDTEWGKLIYLGYGGEKVHKSDIIKILELFTGVQICQGYGLTEASPMVSYIPPELSISKRDVFLDKVDSVGIPLNGLKVIIDGANSDTGEILISGPSITSGYYNDNSADIFKDGYLRTGDIGFIDPDGYIFVTGRKKNIVIVQGMNVQIEEIEQILRSYEPVEDVKVYGKPDEFSGERLCADIVSKSEICLDDIKRFMTSKVDNHKIPAEIHIVDEINRVGGKIKR